MRGARYAGGSAGGGGQPRGASSLQERARLQIGGRAWEERTPNMEFMFVTLEVSKLSGWLNADAACRGSNGGMRGAGRGVRCRSAQAGGGGRPRRTRSVQARARLQIRGQGTGRSARRTCRPW